MENIAEIPDKIQKNWLVRWTAKFHKTFNCCCFCCSTSFGVKFLTLLHTLFLLNELAAWYFDHVSPGRLILKTAILVPFYMMLVWDRAFSRGLALTMYLIVVPLLMLINLVQHWMILGDYSLFT